MKSSSSRDLDGKTSKQWRSAGFTILLLVHKINSKYRGKAGALKQSGPGLKCCLSLLLWIRMDFRQTYSLGLLSDAIPGTFDLCFPGIYSKHAGIYWGYLIPVTCRCSHKFLKRERKKKKKKAHLAESSHCPAGIGGTCTSIWRSGRTSCCLLLCVIGTISFYILSD